MLLLQLTGELQHGFSGLWHVMGPTLCPPLQGTGHLPATHSARRAEGALPAVETS